MAPRVRVEDDIAAAVEAVDRITRRLNRSVAAFDYLNVATPTVDELDNYAEILKAGLEAVLTYQEQSVALQEVDSSAARQVEETPAVDPDESPARSKRRPPLAPELLVEVLRDSPRPRMSFQEIKDALGRRGVDVSASQLANRLQQLAEPGDLASLLIKPERGWYELRVTPHEQTGRDEPRVGQPIDEEDRERYETET